jgi:hypothetical protein
MFRASGINLNNKPKERRGIFNFYNIFLCLVHNASIHSFSQKSNMFFGTYFYLDLVVQMVERSVESLGVLRE